MPQVEITLQRPHVNQQKILDNAKRFNHVKCGRRFGKTSLIEVLSLPALSGKFVGVWFPTYKDLDTVWNALLNLYFPVILKKNEQLKQIILINGGHVHFWSMEDPDSGRGQKYHRAIIDEAAKAKKLRLAWTQTIRATLTDYKGDAWFFSTPKGKNNYFFTLETEMRQFSDWAFFRFTSYDNPFLDPKEIEDAKRQLDDLSFRQEYLAEDVDANDRPFFYAFNEAQHVAKKFVPNLHLPLNLSFDFNKDPMTALVSQSPDVRRLCIFDELKLMNGSTPELCEIITAKYKDWIGRINVTGDASGANRTPLVRGGLNHYKIIKQALHVKDFQFKVRRANLSHINSRVLCNSVLQNADFTITENCRETLRDIRYGSVDEDGTIVKTTEQGLHFLDNVRYTIDAMFYDFITRPNKYAKR